MSTIGEKIRKIREIKGLKQEVVAKSLGLSVNQYGKLERNESSITIERLEEIAQILDVPAKEIMGFDEKSILISTPNSTFNNSVLSSVQNTKEVHNHVPSISDNEKALYEENKRLLEQRIVFLEGELQKKG